MGLVNRGGTPPQILIGPSATDPKFDDLVDALRSDGCDVRIFDDIPIEVPIPKRGSALFVVTQRDTVDTAEGQRVQGLIREAGYVEGQLGRSRVLLLVDESAPRLSDTGLEQIRYPAGNLAAVHGAVASRLRLTDPSRGRVRRWSRRTGPSSARADPRAVSVSGPEGSMGAGSGDRVCLGACRHLVFRNLLGGEGGGQVAAEQPATTPQTNAADADGTADSEAEGGEGPSGPATASDRSSGQLGGLTAAVEGDGAERNSADATATTYVTFAPSSSPQPVVLRAANTASALQSATTQPVTTSALNNKPRFDHAAASNHSGGNHASNTTSSADRFFIWSRYRVSLVACNLLPRSPQGADRRE